jgi:hypothetical protein
MNEVFLQIARRKCFVCNFSAMRNNRVLVVIASDRDLSTLRDLPGAMAGKQYQFKTIFNFVDAIFDCDAGHCLSFANCYGEVAPCR